MKRGQKGVRFIYRQINMTPFYLIRPDGIAVAETGYHSRDMLDTSTRELSDSYNNPPAGALLSVAENFVKEPPAPVYSH